MPYEQLTSLCRRERQLARPQLGDCAVGTEPCEPESGICSRDADHPRVRRQVRQGMIDRGQALRVGHRLQVVEHDDQLVPERRDAVHELVDGTLDGAAHDAQPLQRPPPEPRPYPVDRRCNVCPQP